MKRFNMLIVIALICIAITSFGQRQSSKPRVSKAAFFGKTIPLRDKKPVPAGTVEHNGWKGKIISNNFKLPTYINKSEKATDPAIQSTGYNSRNTQQTIKAFDGMNQNNSGGYTPPDTHGDVGPAHYLQMVNATFEVYDKNTGNSVYGPADNSTIWAGFTGPWSSHNDGDPIVLYDDAADRWFVSQFAIDVGSTHYIMIAISETNDPLGSWYCYAFEFPNQLPDYPKFGIWADGYYMGLNSTVDDASVFERDAMLAGNPDARMVNFTINNKPASGFHCVMPADCDGAMPPQGTPNYFVTINDGSWGGQDEIRMWEFNVDWTNTANSTFSTIPNALPVSAFDSNFSGGWENLPQPGTTQKLDAIYQILMYRVQYRNMGTHQSIVACHTVDVNGSDQAAIRWYELRNTGNGWTIYQQSTYSPDTKNRWMGSIAMNSFGDIGLGFLYGSSTNYLSTYYTGRLASDPLNQMTFTETSVGTGAGSQKGSERDGDYSMTSVDPFTGNFWHTNEYLPASGSWNTKIAHFRLVGTTPPTADFSASKKDLISGEYADFTDLSTNTPTKWNWTFFPNTVTYINGTSAKSQNPRVQFDAVGNYRVALDAGNNDGSDTETKFAYITVQGPPTADFKANITSACDLSTIITFTDKTTGGATAWAWTFTPNTVTYKNGTSATSQNPQVTFDVAGTYSVTLTVTNALGSDSELKNNYITAGGVFGIPFTESFENGFGCWATYVGSNGLGTTKNWTIKSSAANTGKSSAFVDYEDVTGGMAEDWLVTPMINLQGTSMLSFYQMQGSATNYDSKYDVRISTTSQNNPASFTTISSWTEADFGTSFSNKLLDISAYDGQSVYIAFVFTNDNGDDWSIDDVEVSGTLLCTPPTTQASNVNTSAASKTTLTVNWTRGNGDKVLVLAHKNTAVDAKPRNGNVYTANAAWGSGNEIGAGNFVVYAGAGTSVTVSGLTAGNTYHFAVFEYNSNDNCYTKSAATTSGSTTAEAEPTNYPTDFTVSGVSSSAVSLTWTDATGAILPQNYLIKASTGAITPPTDGITESDATLVKNVAYGTNAITFLNLLPATTYNFNIYPYTNSGAQIDYKTSGTGTTTTGTTAEGPAVIWTDNCNAAGTWTMNTGTGAWKNVKPTTPANDHTGGGNCFKTNGNANYDNFSYILTSPSIKLTNYTACELTFWMWMDAEEIATNWDGGFIECFDGTVWTKINNPDLSIAYDDFINGAANNPYANEEAWTHDRTFWTQVTVNISKYDNTADFKFRFKFGGDEAAHEAGWAIDDCEIKGIPPPNGVWIGADSDDWSVAENWSNNVIPDANTDVNIPSGKSAAIYSPTTVVCKNMTIASGANLTINNGASLTVSGTFTIQSNGTTTGSFIQNGTFNVTPASVSVQRLLPAASRYYYLSQPVTGATARVFGTSAELSNSTPDDRRLFEHDGANWVRITDETKTLNTFQGYAFRTTPVANAVYTFKGSLNNGTQNINLHDNNFTLVGNPYPSYLDWGLNTPIGWSATNVASTIWYRKGGDGGTDDAGNFATYNRLGGTFINNGQRFIAPMQAFWVKSSATATSLGVDNTARTHATGNVKDASKSSGIRIMVRDAAGNTDETMLAINAASLNAYDAYDSDKLLATENDFPQIYTIADNINLAIQSLTGVADSINIPLMVKKISAGEITFASQDFNTFPANISVYLEDVRSGAMTNMKTTNYTTQITGGNAVAFVLHLRNTSTAVAEQGFDDVTIWSNGQHIFVQNNRSKQAEIAVYNIQGAEVVQTKIAAHKLAKLDIPNPSGYYFTTVTIDGKKITRKVFVK